MDHPICRRDIGRGRQDRKSNRDIAHRELPELTEVGPRLVLADAVHGDV